MNVSDTRIEHVLLLAEHEALVAVDRAALRRLGAGRVRLLSQGQEALRVLKGARAEFPPVSMLVCHERLADMTGLAFLQALRQDPALASLPLVLLTGHKESDLARKARAFGGCALLARPYTQDDAETALREAIGKVGLIHHMPEACVKAVAPVPSVSPVPLEPAAAQPSGAEGFFRHGLKAMRDGEMAEAQNALLQAYTLDPMHAEACLALSRRSKGLDREQESQAWLCRAGVACLRRQDPERAHDIFSRLPRVKGGANPLVPETARLLHEGENQAAAFAVLEAQALEPEQPLHTIISKVAAAADAPDTAMRSLCNALAGSGYASAARELQNRMFLSVLDREERAASGFLNRFPVLRDIASIASFTFKAWKHAA